MSGHDVIWHDLECHGYAADLPLWHEIARAAGGRVLEVGAGTGRVSLDLAAAGFDVTALDDDTVLLAALRERAERRGLTVAIVAADATAASGSFGAPSGAHPPLFAGRAPLGAFGAVIVPMQTVQLLDDRAGFLANARAWLAPGGVLAMAIAEDLEPFDGDGGFLPEPDTGSRDGWQFSSQAVTIAVEPGLVSIGRVRETTEPGGTVTSVEQTLLLRALDAEQLEREGVAAGFTAGPRRALAATDVHVGSTVVVLHA